MLAVEQTTGLIFVAKLFEEFGEEAFAVQKTVDDIPTLWLQADLLQPVLKFLKPDFPMLYDLFGIDERLRDNRQGQPESDFTVVYHLLSLTHNLDFRLKLAAQASAEAEYAVPTITELWANANWYEREAWDMFGISFTGHPNLYRILLPPTWKGHALRKDHPARATEMEPFSLNESKQAEEQEALRFRPEEWGMQTSKDGTEYMFLNLGPNHPSVHGVFRIALQLDGEVVVDAVPDIGYHHRGAEKMGERQSWPSYMPYTIACQLKNLPASRCPKKPK
jgi:NADH-quinone oxidoreductase subunit C/D